MTEVFEENGVRVVMSHLPGFTGYKVWARVAKVGAPVLSDIIPAMQGALVDSGEGQAIDFSRLQVSDLSGPIGEFFEALSSDPKLLVDLFQSSKASIGSKMLEMDEAAIDLIFSGKILTLVKCTIAALQFQFNDFLELGQSVEDPNEPKA